MLRPTKGRFGAVALALSLLPGAWADGPYVSDTARVSWEDNVTNASAGNGVLGAFSFGAGTTLSWLHSGGFSTLILSDLSADFTVCTSYRGLSNIEVGPRLEVRQKLGLGAFAPSLYAGIDGKATGFQDPEQSKIEGAFIFGYSQRLSEAFQVQLDGRLGSYDAQDIVFTGNYASLAGALNWDLDETWRIRVTGGWRAGDTVSNYTAVMSPYGWIPIESDALNLPGAWHYVRTFDAPFVAYRVSARTWSYGISVSPAIGRHTSLTLEVKRVETVGAAPYLDTVVSLSVAHRY